MECPVRVRGLTLRCAALRMGLVRIGAVGDTPRGYRHTRGGYARGRCLTRVTRDARVTLEVPRTVHKGRRSHASMTQVWACSRRSSACLRLALARSLRVRQAGISQHARPDTDNRRWPTRHARDTGNGKCLKLENCTVCVSTKVTTGVRLRYSCNDLCPPSAFIVAKGVRIIACTFRGNGRMVPMM